eukprot:GHVS01072184.1.p1 GENE.GHVS01072184.1~~GHVS01072184.1.p1  ORF type:complete len:344 (+),score=42.95 GHVS01072184.1:97-1032(+)
MSSTVAAGAGANLECLRSHTVEDGADEEMVASSHLIVTHDHSCLHIPSSPIALSLPAEPSSRHSAFPSSPPVFHRSSRVSPLVRLFSPRIKPSFSSHQRAPLIYSSPFPSCPASPSPTTGAPMTNTHSLHRQPQTLLPAYRLPTVVDQKAPGQSSTAFSYHQQKAPQSAPMWRLLAPFSLRFKRPDLEEAFAQFVQAQISKNLWWSLLVLIIAIGLEYLITALTTPSFRPLHHQAQLAYTIGTLVIIISGALLSALSRFKCFSVYLEIAIAAGGTLFTIILVFFSDHYRVAQIFGYTPEAVWGRPNFSDGP